MDKIFKQLYPGVKEEYLERAFEKLKKNGCVAWILMPLELKLNI